MVNYLDTSRLNKFQKFFYEYARYHRNLINTLIHMIFIPIITFTYFKIFDIIIYDTLKLNVSFNPFLLIWALWIPIYIYTDLLTGLIVSILYPLMHYLTLNYKIDLFGLGNNYSVILIHIISWIIQFIGHGVFEKRKPALMDNPLLVFNAPVFVVIELLYFIGYRKREIDEVMLYVDADINEYKKHLIKSE